jgi:hypothetical protein
MEMEDFRIEATWMPIAHPRPLNEDTRQEAVMPFAEVSNQLVQKRRTAKAVKAIHQQFSQQIKNASVHRLNVFRCAYSVVF